MKIIIVGAGTVGTEIARRLSWENHDVTVIDKDPQVTARLEDLDILPVIGNGASIKVLMEAGVQKADILIAATEIDEVNIIACMVAKKSGTKKTVARVRNPEYISNETRLFPEESLGCDLMINPEGVAALELAKLIRMPTVAEIEYFAEGRVQLVTFKVDPDSEIAGRQVHDLPLLGSGLIAAISREDGRVIIPGGRDVIQPHDLLYVIGKTGVLSEVGWLVRKPEDRVRNIMILGGGRIGFQLAQILEKHRTFGLNVRLIERDPDRCAEIAEQLEHTLVLRGDATDLTFLKEEQIQGVDAVVALTGDDQDNILTGMLAKRLGVRRVLVEINRSDYDPIVRSFGIDCTISPRLVTAGEILKLVHHARVVSLAILEQEKAEMVELVVPEDARACGSRLSELRLPRGIIVGAIMRENKIVIPKGKDYINAGDRVIIFTLPETAHQVDHYFS